MIREDILKHLILLSVMINFLTNVYIFSPILNKIDLCVDFSLEFCKMKIILFGVMLPRVTDKVYVAETAVWSSPFSFICSLLLKEILISNGY